MTEPQVPRMCDVMSPAFDALAEASADDRARLARNFHANHGRFGDILRGWQGQAEVARARLAREIIATRLIASNGGQPLRDLAASEYFATLAQEPRFAIGEMGFNRSVENASSGTTGHFFSGVIPAGTRITRPKTDTGDFPMADADFSTTEDVVCSADDTFAPVDLGGGQWLHQQTVFAPIVASRPGTDGNTPTVFAGVIASKLFDSSLALDLRFRPGTITSAGGLVEVPDAQLLDFAKAMGQGFNGANNAAALAGCRSDPRVRRVAASLDYTTAILWLYVADQSWATSLLYRDTIKQALFDNKWIGFGSRVAFGRIFNTPITVKATVYLRSKAYEAEKSAITDATLVALRGYFDDRADFYSWKTNAVGGVIATADQRIQTCANPLVTSEGSILPEPASSIAGGAVLVPHFSLRGVELTFASPGA